MIRCAGLLLCKPFLSINSQNCLSFQNNRFFQNCLILHLSHPYFISYRCVQLLYRSLWYNGGFDSCAQFVPLLLWHASCLFLFFVTWLIVVFPLFLDRRGSEHTFTPFSLFLCGHTLTSVLLCLH